MIGIYIIFFNSSHRQQQGEPVYSKALKVSGLTWRLKVYPVSILVFKKMLFIDFVTSLAW